jgi:hypothetical protein
MIGPCMPTLPVKIVEDVDFIDNEEVKSAAV